MDLVLPEALADQATLGPQWARWVAGLPRQVRDVAREWGLTQAGTLRHGYNGLVVPVTLENGTRAALKLVLVDDESQGEIPALKVWSGRGAVRLLRSDPRRSALLLEWLDGDATRLPPLESCEAVAGLYPTLHVRSDPRVPPLAPLLTRWLADAQALGDALPVPRRLARHAFTAAARLLADAPEAVVHGDLHGENVMRRGDEWVAIDPKGFLGDPAYEPAPMLWNRWGEGAWGEPADASAVVRERFATLVDAGGLDPVRARDWVVVRSVLNASWQVLEAQGRPLSPGASEWVTRCVTTAKAVLADAV